MSNLKQMGHILYKIYKIVSAEGGREVGRQEAGWLEGKEAGRQGGWEAERQGGWKTE